jgi:glycerol-3-phosphate acyltransferase PlsY
VPWLSHLATALGAYLLGSIPTGYLVARARGVDIRQVGSGNIGATNVFRILGRTAGVMVLAIDFLKGWLACSVLVAWTITVGVPPGAGRAADVETLTLLAGVCAVLGHIYTCWLRFKGGKGIATSAGVLTALVPWALVVLLVVWTIVCILTRYVSLASVAAAVTLPFAVWLTGGSLTLILVTAGLSSLAIYKHRANIRRLTDGTEPRLKAPRKSQAP